MIGYLLLIVIVIWVLLIGDWLRLRMRSKLKVTHPYIQGRMSLNQSCKHLCSLGGIEFDLGDRVQDKTHTASRLGGSPAFGGYGTVVELTNLEGCGPGVTVRFDAFPFNPMFMARAELQYEEQGRKWPEIYRCIKCNHTGVFSETFNEIPLNCPKCGEAGTPALILAPLRQIWIEAAKSKMEGIKTTYA